MYFLVALCWTCHATHISRWGPEDAKNGVGVRKVRFFTLDNCSVMKSFFWFVSTCLLHMYACYICTNGFSCSIALDMSCLCYVYNTPDMCYICNKFVMGVTFCFCYICNSHSFLQMFAQHCYLCNKRQHPECQRKELWQEVSKFVCDMTTCYIPDWHSYLHISWSNCFVTHAAEANVWNASQKQLCQKR